MEAFCACDGQPRSGAAERGAGLTGCCEPGPPLRWATVVSAGNRGFRMPAKAGCRSRGAGCALADDRVDHDRLDVLSVAAIEDAGGVLELAARVVAQDRV